MESGHADSSWGRFTGREHLSLTSERFGKAFLDDQFAANDADASRGLDADLYARRAGLNDPDHNVIANMNGLSLFAGQH